MSLVFKRAGWVILCALCICPALAYYFNINSAVSFALGASISFIPTVIFGQFFLRTKNGRTAKKVVSAFYVGETLKILTTIALFIFVFQWHDLKPLFLFLGFMTAQLGCILAFFSAPQI